MSERATIFACDRCGRHVGCPCGTGRSAAVLAEQHRQAVARAQRAPVAVTVQDAMDLAAERQRTVRPQQRATPGQPSLDEMTDIVIGKRRAA